MILEDVYSTIYQYPSRQHLSPSSSRKKGGVTYLFVNGSPLTEHVIPSDQPRYQTMPFGNGTFAARRFKQTTHGNGEELVQRRECSQVQGVLLCGSQDERELFAWCTPTEEEGHD